MEKEDVRRSCFESLLEKSKSSGWWVLIGWGKSISCKRRNVHLSLLESVINDSFLLGSIIDLKSYGVNAPPSGLPAPFNMSFPFIFTRIVSQQGYSQFLSPRTTVLSTLTFLSQAPPGTIWEGNS